MLKSYANSHFLAVVCKKLWNQKKMLFGRRERGEIFLEILIEMV